MSCEHFNGAHFGAVSAIRDGLSAILRRQNIVDKRIDPALQSSLQWVYDDANCACGNEARGFVRQHFSKQIVNQMFNNPEAKDY